MPAKLPAAARNAVLRSLLARNLLAEIPAPRDHLGLGWRQDQDGTWIALRTTEAGLQAISVEPEPEAQLSGEGEPQDSRRRDERRSVDPGLIIGDLADETVPSSVPALQKIANLPTAGQGDSMAAFSPAPPF
jgi:hypothetical protein